MYITYISWLHFRIFTRDDKRALYTESLWQFDLKTLKHVHNLLCDVLGGCEKIRSMSIHVHVPVYI